MKTSDETWLLLCYHSLGKVEHQVEGCEAGALLAKREVGALYSQLQGHARYCKRSTYLRDGILHEQIRQSLQRLEPFLAVK